MVPRLTDCDRDTVCPSRCGIAAGSTSPGGHDTARGKYFGGIKDKKLLVGCFVISDLQAVINFTF